MSSHPNVFFGAAFWIQGEGGHPAFIASAPEDTGGIVLFVRLTSYKEHLHEGRKIYSPSEYSELVKDSVIHYGGIKEANAKNVEEGVRLNAFKILEPIPPAILGEMIREMNNSKILSPKFIRLLGSDDHPACTVNP